MVLAHKRKYKNLRTQLLKRLEFHDSSISGLFGQYQSTISKEDLQSTSSMWKHRRLVKGKKKNR
jgi:hypothetical protein